MRESIERELIVERGIKGSEKLREKKYDQFKSLYETKATDIRRSTGIKCYIVADNG